MRFNTRVWPEWAGESCNQSSEEQGCVCCSAEEQGWRQTWGWQCTETDTREPASLFREETSTRTEPCIWQRWVIKELSLVGTKDLRKEKVKMRKAEPGKTLEDFWASMRSSTLWLRAEIQEAEQLWSFLFVWLACVIWGRRPALVCPHLYKGDSSNLTSQSGWQLKNNV